MLRRLALRDFVIVPALELEFHTGFSVLTGETGAGKSILIDALQLALGSRGDVGLVREGAARAEVSAEFDTPGALTQWLDDAGFGTDPDEAMLLLRRTIDAQGKSRAWINGSPATLLQLREVADHLLDIHGQHAWQSLTKASATRAMVDAQAGLDTSDLAGRFADRKAAAEVLARARDRGEELSREREQLRLEAKRLESQRRQRIGVRQLKRHKQPRQFRLLRFGVMVKLKRKHEQPFAGFQRDRAVIHAHRRAGPQRQHQHEPVMQRPAASRFVQVAGRPALEAHEVVGQNQRLGRATLQLVQRLG